MADTEDFSTLKERAKKKLERDMGPLLLGALNDPRTVEIMLNADGKLWQERLGEKMKCIGSLRVAQSEAIIKTIAGNHRDEIGVEDRRDHHRRVARIGEVVAGPRPHFAWSHAFVQVVGCLAQGFAFQDSR